MSANERDDADVLGHIEALVSEEQRLHDAGESGTLDDAGRARLQALRVDLDRYYDLLRQRRARREFGQDPDEAHLRSGETVENYLQ